MEPSKVKSSLVVTILVAFLFMVFTVTGYASQAAPTIYKTNVVKVEDHGALRIGYQKNGPLAILMARGTLEKSLQKEGFTVEWKQFTAGPPMLEALNAGSIDFGRTGDSPPIFAQAARTPFVYVAAGKSKFKGSGILVPKGSTVKSVKDLKGKRVAFAKGSSSHYLLIKALKKAGLNYTDIKPAFLQPGEGRIALEQGNVDAWVVWDPFTADTEIHSKAKLLVTGEGLTYDRDYFVANKDFAKKYPQILKIVVAEIIKSSLWANTHHTDLVNMVAPVLKIDKASILRSAQRREYGIDPITPEIIKGQQSIADTFYHLKIIPRKIQVKDLFLK